MWQREYSAVLTACYTALYWRSGTVGQSTARTRRALRVCTGSSKCGLCGTALFIERSRYDTLLMGVILRRRLLGAVLTGALQRTLLGRAGDIARKSTRRVVLEGTQRVLKGYSQ
jgi:hypothetical protein